MCGEHTLPSPQPSPRSGSSPRVWGAPQPPGYPDPQPRLIPTCVGSTQGYQSGLAPATAHPHVCGEHIPLGHSRVGTLGSSPRVWGALLGTARSRSHRRLIPTCVGSTRPALFSWCTRPAHPHVCGEHYLKTQTRDHFLGSSPRVWGARGFSVNDPGRDRLIPTCVGSTCIAPSSVKVITAHPHVCGEHHPTRRCVPAPGGSSPRVWGAPDGS